MSNLLLRFDGLLSATRPAWIGLGQLGVAILGLHLAADRLDDLLVGAMNLVTGPINGVLVSGGFSAIETGSLLAPSVWIALITELLLVVYLFDSLTLSPQQATLDWRAWLRALSPHAVAMPLFWAPAAAAGAWAVGMAIEDVLAPTSPLLGAILGRLIGLLVAWRLSWTGWRRVVTGLTPPAHRWKGLLWAPPLLGMGGLAFWYGLPIRGFLPW